jgi:hypothetical protein
MLFKPQRLALALLSAILFLPLFYGIAHGAGPCECKDIDKMQAHLDRVSKSEEVWKEIFAWARELYPGVDLPQTNDDLDQKHTQLTSAPKSQWRELIKEGRVKEKKALEKVAGLNEAGEPVVNDDFKKNNCDDIIEAEHIHEQAHRDFYLSFPKVLEVPMTSRLLRLRAESEVESYRKHKAFLDRKLKELKLKCLTKADRSTVLSLEEALAQRERLNDADIRLRMYGNSPAVLN